MRTNKRLKQKMKYSLFLGEQPVYERDEYGNIKYIEVDGEQIPVDTGETAPQFSEPTEFEASISSKLNEMQAKEYGVDQSSIYSEICLSKQEFPTKFKYGTLIWKDSEVVWKDEIMKIPDETSADYKVVGVLDEFQHFDRYLLQRLNFTE